MASFIHQRPLHNTLPDGLPSSPRHPSNSSRQMSIWSHAGSVLALCLLLILGGIVPWTGMMEFIFSESRHSRAKWREYTLEQGLSFVAKNNTVIVCAITRAYLPFLNNWLISITRQKLENMVLVIAEDYATLYLVNDNWPGHAVLVPPAIDSLPAHKFGSEGFFNFTSRRPHHLLHILELGYNVMYNDVDMIWLGNPFLYLDGNHDIYFTDDLPQVKPLNHSHDLPSPGKKGRTYVCSCMIFLRPTDGAKLVMKKWIEELHAAPWTKTSKSNDQPAFNWALNRTAGKVDFYLLPQAAFPSGGLYFKNETWANETKGQQVIVHNNYITGLDNKIRRFREFGLWLADDEHAASSLDITLVSTKVFHF